MKTLFALATVAFLFTGATFADAPGKEKKKKCEKTEKSCSKKMSKGCCKSRCTMANM